MSGSKKVVKTQYVFKKPLTLFLLENFSNKKLIFRCYGNPVEILWQRSVRYELTKFLRVKLFSYRRYTCSGVLKLRVKESSCPMETKNASNVVSMNKLNALQFLFLFCTCIICTCNLFNYQLIYEDFFNF